MKKWIRKLNTGKDAAADEADEREED